MYFAGALGFLAVVVTLVLAWQPLTNLLFPPSPPLADVTTVVGFVPADSAKWVEAR